MTALIKSFVLCVQFFTRLPTAQYKTVTTQEIGKSLAWFPLIGLIIGLGLVGVAQLSQWLPATVVAVFMLAFWVWITGALHLDGLADTADGWLGGIGSADNHQRALNIMKDSRIGTGGGTAIGLALLFKWALLVEIITAQQTEAIHGWLFLLLSPLLARIATLIYIKTTQYVSINGTGENSFHYLNPVWVIVWATLTITSLLLTAWLFLLIPAWLWVRWVAKKITGGMTGDTAGTMTEVIEISVLLVGVIFLGKI